MPKQSQTEIPPPIAPFSRFGALNPAVLVPTSLPAIALLFAPVDVLDRVPALRQFTELVAGVVPRLGVHANSTNFPQAALLVDSLMVVASAWIALVILTQTTINYRYLLRRHIALGQPPTGVYLVGLLGIPMGVGFIAAHVMLAGDPSWARGATTGRTWFYLFLAFTTPFFAGVLAGGQFLGLRLFLDAYLFSRPVTTRAL